jgi:cytochrome c peroxidase
MHRFQQIFLFLVLMVSAVLAPVGLRAQSPPIFKPPLGLQDMEIPVPPDNPMTPGKIKLGEQLFFDKRLSKTRAMSCETCHVPEKGWTDGQGLSTKADGSVNTRSSPTLYGVAYYPDLYWDGRAKGLEAQILAAWKGQMGGDPDSVAKELEAIPAYKTAFEAELGGGPSPDRIVRALATFVRTIHAGDTPYDRAVRDKKKGDALEGFKVFSETAHCTLCHLPPLYSDGLFHNVGIGMDKEKPDVGRGKIAADDPTMIGAFKTPSLRGVASTGPYFHDGRAQNLEAAVDGMLAGGIKNDHLDEKLKPAGLSVKQKAQLIAFLRALTPEPKPYPRPTLP